MDGSEISIGVTALVIVAAMLHASWNAILKNGDDKLLDVVFAGILWAPFGLVLLFFIPLPAPESWLFLVLSSCVHMAYTCLLARTYASGDLSHAYVLLRGFSPFLIALGGFIFLGEALSTNSWAGIVLVTCGLVFMGWPAKGEVFCMKTLLFVCLTAACIVTYTLIDGVGARTSGSPIGYLVCFGLLQVPLLSVLVYVMRGKEGFIYGFRNWQRSTAILFLSYAAYGIVLWAMTKAPIGIVSALRETSVIFAVLIGVFLFKEGFAKKRIVAAILVCIGTILIKI